jgi:hypothetical protein
MSLSNHPSDPIGSDTFDVTFDSFGGYIGRISLIDAEPIRDGNWHHIAAVYDMGVGETRLYFDGLLVGQNTKNLPLTLNDDPFSIGNSLGFNYTFRGYIDEVRLWNVARTQDQINEFMNRELCDNEVGLAGYWKFNEVLGSTALDHSGNGNHGTFTGTPVWVNTGPNLSSCVTETKLDFEAPLPDGLIASTDRLLGDFVPLSSRVANHYASQGVIFEDVGLLYLEAQLGLPATNFIQSYGQNSIIDHDVPYKIKFVSLADENVLATTKFFSIDSDRLGGSGRSFTASGYDIDGNFLGSSTANDTTFPGLGSTVTLRDIGDIHHVILQGAYSIAFDDMEFGPILVPPTELVVNRGPLDGIWMLDNNTTWEQISTLRGETVVRGDMDGDGIDDVIVDFGLGDETRDGLWAWRNGVWVELPGNLTPRHLAVGDLDCSGQDDLIADFGSSGIQALMNNGNVWRVLHGLPSEGMVIGDIDGSCAAGGDDLILDFGPAYGLHVFKNNTTYQMLTHLSPERMVTGDLDCSGKDDVIVDFATSGDAIQALMNGAGALLTLHGSPSEVLVTADIDGTCASGADDLIIDFGSAIGLHARMSDGSYNQLEGLSPLALVAGDIDGSGKDDLVADFGPGEGFRKYMNQGGWQAMPAISVTSLITGHMRTAAGTPADDDGDGMPNANVAGDAGGDLDGDGYSNLIEYLEGTDPDDIDWHPAQRDDLVIDFGSTYGIHRFANNVDYRMLRGGTAAGMVIGDMDCNGQDDVVIDLDPADGIRVMKNNDHSTWQLLHGLSPDDLALGDVDGSCHEDLIIDFGPSFGVYLYMNDNGVGDFRQITGSSPEEMTVGDFDGNGKDDVAFDFSASGPGYNGIWLYMNDSQWLHRHGLSAEGIAVGDLDCNGSDDLIAHLWPYGLYAFMNNGGWVQLDSRATDAMVTGDLDGSCTTGKDDLVVDFGTGGHLMKLMNNSNWLPVHGSLSPVYMAVGDLDGSGKDDLVIDFGNGFGLYKIMNNSSWWQMHGLTSEGLAVGNLDGKTLPLP